MVDAAQVIYEHTAGNTLSFKTDNLTITILRPFLSIDARPDGNKLVTDNNVFQRIFKCSAKLTGDNWKVLHDWLIGSITYSGIYPRLTTVYFDGDTTISNIEVAITQCSARDMGDGWWMVNIQFTEKSL